MLSCAVAQPGHVPNRTAALNAVNVTILVDPAVQVNVRRVRVPQEGHRGSRRHAHSRPWTASPAPCCFKVSSCFGWP